MEIDVMWIKSCFAEKFDTVLNVLQAIPCDVTTDTENLKYKIAQNVEELQNLINSL